MQFSYPPQISLGRVTLYGELSIATNRQIKVLTRMGQTKEEKVPYKTQNKSKKPTEKHNFVLSNN
jgi:hypothetical protein